MHPFYILLIVLGGLTLLFFTTCYICFFLPFYVTKKARKRPQYELPPGDYFEPYKEQLLTWMREMDNYPSEEITIKSFDGLKLSALYFEVKKGAPVEIMFHGYRGTSKRDLCGGLNRCLSLRRNVLLVDQRGSGKSEGKVITFGIKERFDVKAWAEYAYNRFGDTVPLLITGISMGASSIIMASSLDLPKTVVAGVADCGYSSGREMIMRVVKSMKLPPKLFFPFIKLGGIIFGGFNIDETTPLQEVKKAKIPIIFIHGDEDDLVPAKMSEINYNACASEKHLEIIEGAGHGAALLVNPEKYLQALADFEQKHLKI